MVDESWPWKRDLLHEADVLELRIGRYATGRRRSPSGHLRYRIERFAFLFAFVTRKLLDSNKLSQELESVGIRVTANHKRTRTRKPRGDEHPIMEHYVFSKPKTSTLSLRRLCDVLIHSHDFLIGETPDKSFELAFNSDRTTSEIYQLELRSLIELAREVGNDDVIYAESILDPNTGERVWVVRSRNPRPHRDGADSRG